MKDNFSRQAEQYAKFRPGYPKELVDFLLTIVPSRETAWDCGTGNGQLAVALSAHFAKVYGTDISVTQLRNAVRKSNIIYKLERAEETSLQEKEIDLVTVGQALHWFDFDAFYREVNRTLKPGGVIAVTGYAMFVSDAATDKIIKHFYDNITGPYWDDERKWVDELYKTIPFPFVEVKTPVLISFYDWTYEQLLGYLSTWSAVQHYKDANKADPIELIKEDLKNSWGEQETKTFRFPLILRVGIKQ
jgi:ubiquinone/menaquinone biosynthesis C-methylase UbiE